METWTQTFKDLKYINAYVWWFYSMVTIAPLFTLTVYKLFFPINIYKYNDKNPFPHTIQDKIARIFLFWGPIYYIVDSLLIILIGDFNGCSISYILHHIVSFIFLPSVIKQNYYPWFLCLVPFLHAVILALPEVLWLNYVYLFGCGLYQFGLYQEPFRNMKSYKFLQTGTWILEFTLVLLWAFGCKNTMV